MFFPIVFLEERKMSNPIGCVIGMIDVVWKTLQENKKPNEVKKSFHDSLSYPQLLVESHYRERLHRHDLIKLLNCLTISFIICGSF